MAVSNIDQGADKLEKAAEYKVKALKVSNRNIEDFLNYNFFFITEKNLHFNMGYRSFDYYYTSISLIVVRYLMIILIYCVY